MELRHLRYFVAVAEDGSLTHAADRLHTAQPSLSRQIRNLESEVGVALLTRNVRGVELTPAGRAFLDHARLALSQVEAAGEAARRVAQAAKPAFKLGFLTGQELEWLPAAMRILGGQLPNIDITVSSNYSPDLADALMSGKIDAAFMRREAHATDLEFVRVATEPLVVLLPADHRLASHTAIDPREFKGESFISVSSIAPMLRIAIDDYLAALGLEIRPSHEVHNLTMAMSLIASTHSVALAPTYARNYLPSTVTTRPLQGIPPSIDLVVGYRKANTSPILGLFVSRLDELVDRGQEAH
jgi:LysR family hca operon transcriptional activator